MFWRIVLLIFGVACAASAVIMIKRCDVDPALLASYRLILAAAVLSPLFVRDLRRHRAAAPLRRLHRSILPGVLLGGHFITWIIGARMTPAVNSSLIVNMVPVVMPLYLWMWMRERINAGEAIGTGVAITGMTALAAVDFRLNAEYFWGDALCFGSMLLFAGYLALARRNRDVSSVWLYLVPLYFVGGVFCFAVALLWTSPPGLDSANDVAMVVGLAIVPTVLGHSITNYSMRHIRGQIVSLLVLSQFLFAGVMGYFLLRPREIPPWSFYLAALPIVAGCAIALWYTPQPVQPPPAENDAADKKKSFSEKPASAEGL